MIPDEQSLVGSDSGTLERRVEDGGMRLPPSKASRDPYSVEEFFQSVTREHLLGRSLVIEVRDEPEPDPATQLSEDFVDPWRRLRLGREMCHVPAGKQGSERPTALWIESESRQSPGEALLGGNFEELGCSRIGDLATCGRERLDKRGKRNSGKMFMAQRFEPPQQGTARRTAPLSARDVREEAHDRAEEIE